jgi:hypothetical protein
MAAIEIEARKLGFNDLDLVVSAKNIVQSRFMKRSGLSVIRK